MHERCYVDRESAVRDGTYTSARCLEDGTEYGLSAETFEHSPGPSNIADHVEQEVNVPLAREALVISLEGCLCQAFLA